MTSPYQTMPEGLAALEKRLRQDLDWLAFPAKPWVPARTVDGQAVLDVAVIGAGQAGMAISAALKHLGICAPVFDQSPEGCEGPWATTARMETLRSPKQLTGPALGLPALTFRAWFEAQFGPTAWDELDKIPRLQWMAYLRWYRRVLELDVRNEHRVSAVLPRDDALVALQIETPTGSRSVLARRVVLATGRDGLGGAYVPELARRLPRERWCHSSDDMDYGRLAGLRVAVIGAGASAMDSAATALESGAAGVDLLIRRADLPRINKGKGAGNPGLTHGHLDLSDDWKWRIRHYINSQQTPPPAASVQRVSRHANARFNFGCPILDVRLAGDALQVSTPKREFTLDFLIFSTGFRIDWLSRPEFLAIAPHVRTWGERYAPPPGQEDGELSDSPDLGPAFELQEKTAGACPGLSRVHCLCYPATLSHGPVSGDIPAISDGALRLARGIASLLYREDVDIHYVNLQSYAEPELLGDEWVAADAAAGAEPAEARS